MRHPSLLKQHSRSRRAKRSSRRISASPVDQHPSLFQKLVVKSIVALLIVFTTIGIQQQKIPMPEPIKADLGNLMNDSLPFAWLYEEWGGYVGFKIPASESGISNITAEEGGMYALPVSSTVSSKITRHGDELLVTAVKGENIVAAEAGIVLFVGERQNGETVIIQHPDQRQSYYRNVTLGSLRTFDYVERGENIGYVKENEGFYFSIQDETGFLDPSYLFLVDDE
ncbi:M23 family metallopeptidase [Jeotgalibacillus soli]|uniref:M23ase beta-sheet core domain-containing protein n=1 Tax=Jeotgalibacillus soli TaxID=889306 RepID=A0A0C2VJ94_9BACL|nr:M23 family metallopeptidase [Jeotgalibacillus soli]KIL44551.1 hypothetical protein KP78_35150 [Jeotgalibacillus soli]